MYQNLFFFAIIKTLEKIRNESYTLSIGKTRIASCYKNKIFKIVLRSKKELFFMEELMKNRKNNKKGFTLIEILVVVVIIGALSAIAMPGYMRSVERSRAANPMANLSAIAKAQKAYSFGTEHYTDNISNLDISLTDETNGEDAAGNTFESEFFTYRVYGDDRAVAVAMRKNVSADKQYELSVEYGSGQIYCRPIENKTCIDLGLEEGQDYSQVPWNDCSSNDPMQISCYTRDNNGVSETAQCGYTFYDMNTGYHNPMCSIESQEDGIGTNKGCHMSNAVEGFCQDYEYMYQYGPQGNRDCYEIINGECNLWGDWHIEYAM